MKNPISKGMFPLKLTLSGSVSALLTSWAKLFQRFWQRSSTARGSGGRDPRPFSEDFPNGFFSAYKGGRSVGKEERRRKSG